MILQTPCRLPAMGHRPTTTNGMQVSRYFIGIVCLLMLFAGAVEAQTQQTPSIPVPPTFFADHLINKTDWFTVPTGALGKGTEVNWAYSEPQRGVYNWANLDAWVATAQSHNVDYFFSNDQVPQWAASNTSTCSPTYPGSNVTGCSSGVSNIQDWDDFVTALVTRYKGKIKIYELWNEPNTYFSGTYAEMVQLTQHMHDIVRSIDPNAIIVAPSYTCSSASFPEYAGCVSSLDGYLNAGGVTDVDAVPLHGYPHHDNQTAEAIITTIGTYQQIMAKHGLSGKELWDTEGSWGDSSYSTCCQNASADQQVAFVARHYLLHWSAGVTRYYWYSWDNSGWGTLWDPSGGTHAAGVAYGQVYNWMVGATMTQACAIQSGTVWTCTLTRPNGYTGLVVWNTAGNSSYNAASNFSTYRDLTGKSSAITGTLTIGPKPILLEDQGSGTVSPVAVLAVTPQSGTAPVTVNADSTGSYETGGTIASRSIDFGDGTVASTATASHAYNNAGSYTVKLTVTDASGTSASTTKAVTVTAQTLTPTAVLSVSPQSGTAPVTVTADSSGSYETGGSIASRSIDFGDGTVVSTATASHTYNNAGSYTVKLTVTDGSGKSASTTKAVTVNAQTLTPVAVLSVSPQSGTAPVTVTADSSSSYETGGSIASRKIDFGDGTTANTVTASHTYNSAGNFTVTLTVTDASGKTASATKAVSISASTAPTPVAVLNVTPQTGTAPLYVTADSSGSYETGGSIVSRTIDFGDGTVVTSTSAAHSYSTPGNYVVTLTVKDALGATSMASKGVSVQAVVSSPCTPSTTNRTIVICSPGSTSSSSVQISATATDRMAVKQMSGYVDGKKMLSVSGSTNLSGSVYMSRGWHKLTITAVDVSNISFSSSKMFYIQ